MKDHPRRFLQAVESGMASQPAADGHCAEKPKAIISGQSQAEGMAKFACRVTYQDLTPERRERLKVSILDSLACALVAIGAPPTAACLAQAKEFGGLNGRCTLIGGGTANVVYATLYNTARVCRGSNERDRARGPGQTASGLLSRADDARRAQERRADGGNYGA